MIVYSIKGYAAINKIGRTTNGLGKRANPGFEFRIRINNPHITIDMVITSPHIDNVVSGNGGVTLLKKMLTGSNRKVMASDKAAIP